MATPMEQAKQLRAESNVFLGGAPAAQRFATSSGTTYVDTKDMLVGESSQTASVRREMRQQGQLQHFELGAERLDYTTSGAQDDHFSCVTEEEKVKMRAEARLRAFKKKNMQAKHFELGLKPTNYTSLAAASFKWDKEAATSESASTKAEARERKHNAHRTNFVLGAEPCDFKSEAADAFAAPAEERKVGEKLPPAAKSSNITIGLVPVDYTTSYQDANDKSRAARAKMTGGLKATTGGAGLRATNWTLGLDDNKAEGHYTSQTMKDLWHVKVPEGKGVGAAATRTSSAYADPGPKAPATADDSPEFLATLRTMARR